MIFFKTKSIDNLMIVNALRLVGVTGFEPATTRPPDEYSNRAELHPELRMQKYCFIFKMQMFKELNSCFFLALFLQNTVGYDDVRFIDPCIHDRSRTSEIWYLYLLFR